MADKRQYIGSSIIELEALVEEFNKNTKQLKLISNELSFRKTKRAKELSVELKKILENESLDKRPFISSSIDELKALVLKSSDDKKQLNILLNELANRKTKRAKELKLNVIKLIGTFDF